MIKRFLAFCLLVASVSSNAAQPACWPAEVPGGTGSTTVVLQIAEGMSFVWKCPDGKLYYRAVLLSYTGPGTGALFAEALTYKSPTEALAALWSKYDTPGSGPAWDTLTEKTIAAGRAAFGGKPAFIVAKNGTVTTRPAFAVVAGKRSFSSTNRALVGSACDCAALKLTEGSTTYCQVATNLVAICVPNP